MGPGNDKPTVYKNVPAPTVYKNAGIVVYKNEVSRTLGQSLQEVAMEARRESDEGTIGQIWSPSKELLDCIQQWAMKRRARAKATMLNPPPNAWKQTAPTGLKGLESDVRMEKVAPGHPFGEYLAALWNHWDTKGRPGANFLAWVQSLPPSALRGLFDGHDAELIFAGVKYLNAESRKAYQCEFRAGYVYQGQEKLETTTMGSLHTSEVGWAIWVMGPSGAFYTGRAEFGRLHHSSFLAGGFIRAAGEWKVVSGKVVRISNETGHYRSPSEQLAAAVLELECCGVVAPDARVKPHETGFYVPVRDFLEEMEGKASSEPPPRQAIIGTHRSNRF